MSPQPSAKPFFRSRTGLAFLTFLAIAAFFLITEHTAHVFGILPYVLLLLCPVLHLFMHRGHSGHGSHGGTMTSVKEEKDEH